MTHQIDIFWPVIDPPDIEEVRFSYDFCFRTSRRLCGSREGLTWVPYYPTQDLRHILAQSRANWLAIVTDPEIVLSGAAIERFQSISDTIRGACGPVFNLSEFSDQQAALPAPYLNVTSYVEMAGYLSATVPKTGRPVRTLDAGLVMYRRETLEQYCTASPTSIPVSRVASEPPFEAVVDPGFLVHRFGNYYEGERTDLVDMVPSAVTRVLDIGCARGGFGRKLKQTRPEIHITGVEMNPIMAKSAGTVYDTVITSTIEDADFPELFDLVNCGDVLEHLINPWGMIHRIHDLLHPKGFLVLSVPNAGHWSIVKDLLDGKFRYIPFGLQCISHIRWFTESSIRESLADAGFEVDAIVRQQLPPTPEGKRFLEQLEKNRLGDMQSLLTNELIIRARKP